jgi:molybdopterin-guanine dinucleotide biosynthesis protein A
VPLLNQQFVRRIVELLGDYDMAIPRDGEFSHPLAAVYRTHLANTARVLIAAGERRLLSLVDHGSCRVVNAAELRDVDPELRSLRNINTPEDYAWALRAAGIP